MQQVTFTNIENARIRDLFLAACERYRFPENVKIILKGTQLNGSTMQAQPVVKLRSLFSGIDTYRIRLAKFVRDSQKLKVVELSDDILTGWFAHELGHIIDYMNCSALEIISLGIQYLISAKFRREVEHRADEIAISHGFHDDIIKTKEFLFTHDLIDEKYREKMKRYYMSIEDAKLFIEREISIDPID